ncbi:NEDD4-binding protein 1-like isoform X2 [Colias croceus]|nr:NEDD4-binding protein 1-like isoform X2 [Colias croceus]XP_045507183.1 NEDD4-binding protein 1-like isoform X2 [Colias croceus]XP_045507184.1 NEDD4-binding protein 1-like isoform X2 [Colias croceus]
MSRDSILLKKVSSSGIHKNSKKRKRKNSRKIRNLFDKLRNESSNSESSSNVTVIEITDSNLEAPTEQNAAINPIVIADDDVNDTNTLNIETPRSDINICPLQCSTPNSSRSRTLTNFNEDVLNLTKVINNDSYLTIDLTTESTLNASKRPNAVIDLVNNSQESIDSNISMSGDSDVTVINTQIAKKKNGVNCATETAEDTYIKEVILGRAPSRNSIGSNIYNPERDIKNKTGLRMVVIDGSNVAMQHTKGRIYSVKGLKICIDYFVNRGHVVKAFVPHFRCKNGKSTDGHMLDQLERLGLVVYTPSREIQGRMITSYDDRYIVQCAAEFDGVIVSGDNYRDLLVENPRWRFVIENRLLQFTWVGNMIMFPKDPLGRNGPTLEQFLRHPFPNEQN